MTLGAAAWWALVAVEAAALILAARLATFPEAGNKRRTWQQIAADPLAPLVALLAYALADEVIVEALHRLFVGVPRPFEPGWIRAAYHIETAIVLGWPACLAVASWRVFGWPKHLRPAVAVVEVTWGAWVLAMALSHPMGRTDTAVALHAFELLAVVAALAPIPGAWRRPWGRQHVGVGLLVCVETAVATIGPFAQDVFRDWRVATVGYLVGFVALAGLLGWWLRAAQKSERPARSKE